MGHSIEGRFPFLDIRVAEFAARLPDRLRLRGLREKYALRRRRGQAAAAADPRAAEEPVSRADRRRLLRSPSSPSTSASCSRPERARGGRAARRRRGRQRSSRKFERGAARGVSETDEMALVGCRLDDAPPRAARREPGPGRAVEGDARPSSETPSQTEPVGRGRLMWQPPQRLVHESLLALRGRGSGQAGRRRRGRQQDVGRSSSTMPLRFARLLQDSGLERGDRVALYLDNTALCASAIFGTHARGRSLHVRQSADEGRQARLHPRRQRGVVRGRRGSLPRR